MVKRILDKYDKKYATELLHFAGGYPDWTHTYHHAGFDIVSNRILEIVREYMDKEAEDMFDDYCFWVTGHSMGGGVANIVGAELLHSWNGINNRADNVYCYTFAAPNTFYLTDNKYERENRGIEGKKITGNYREPHGVKYRCIFNIVNDDDFVPKLPMGECEWTKYGRVATLSCISLKNKYYDERIKYINSQLGHNYQFNGDKVKVIKNDYKNYLVNRYKTNLNSIKNILTSFNNMYVDKSNMRSETYKYAKNNNILAYVKFKNLKKYEKGLAFYAKPYQKIEKGNNGEVYQYQMPAYVMQSITNSIHEKVTEYKKNEQGELEYDKDGKPIIVIRAQEPKLITSENKWTFKYAEFVTKEMEKAGWEIIVGEGIFKAIDHPHYVEAYFSLTKELSIISFR